MDDCAHVRDKKITQTELESIGSPLGNNYKEILDRGKSDLRYNLLHVLGMLSAGLSVLVETLEGKKKKSI